MPSQNNSISHLLSILIYCFSCGNVTCLYALLFVGIHGIVPGRLGLGYASRVCRMAGLGWVICGRRAVVLGSGLGSLRNGYLALS